jgi:membrane-associated phospholipid phosphatase
VNGMKAPFDAETRGKAARPIGAASTFAAALGQNTLRNLAQWCGVLVHGPRRQIPRFPAGGFIIIVITLALIVAFMFLIDAKAADWARQLPLSFTNAFEQITNGGLSSWFLIPSGLIVLFLAALNSPALPRMSQGVLAVLAARFGFLFIAVAAPGLFGTIIKRLIGRARPYADFHGDPFTYVPFAWRPEFASLPSGHATTAAAAAVAIGAMWPRTRWVMWLYALVIMFSRVVVLSHHPSDVVAGALVGSIGAALVRRWFAARRLAFSAHLSVYAGPSLRRIRAVIIQALCGAWGSDRSP